MSGYHHTLLCVVLLLGIEFVGSSCLSCELLAGWKTRWDHEGRWVGLLSFSTFVDTTSRVELFSLRANIR